MDYEILTISDFLGMVFIVLPFYIFLTFVLFEGLSQIINFFRYSDRRFRG